MAAAILFLVRLNLVALSYVAYEYVSGALKRAFLPKGLTA